MDSDHVTVLDSQVVADNSVDSGLAILEIVVGEDDQGGVLSLLAANKDSIAPEELKGFHVVVRQGNDGVVIVDSVGDPRVGGGQYTAEWGVWDSMMLT